MAAPLSEDALLRLIDRYFARSASALELGRGDDCAILRLGENLAVSSDLFLEDRHFRTSYFLASEIGHKALAVNLSDIAAMGCRPLAFTLALGLPECITSAWLEEMLAGMAALASQYGLPLCGGDLSGADKIHISITIFGAVQPQGAFLTRSACRPGDILFMAGLPGLARVGLAVLEKYGRVASERWPGACGAHLRPTPQTGTGLALGSWQPDQGRIALMDVSDGIARDLPRLLLASSQEAGVALGAALEISPSMLPGEVIEYARQNSCDAVELALAGGEDYALLGGCALDIWERLRRQVPGLWQIGVVTREEGIWCNGKPVAAASGFDHFAGKTYA